MGWFPDIALMRKRQEPFEIKGNLLREIYEKISSGRRRTNDTWIELTVSLQILHIFCESNSTISLVYDECGLKGIQCIHCNVYKETNQATGENFSVLFRTKQL